jgi:hypothetical protein
MARSVCRVLGFVFVLAGVAGFVEPHLAGLHLTPVHNVIHLVSGLLALYMGYAGSLDAARGFCVGFGAVYGLLGVMGFVAPGVVASLLGHQGDLAARSLVPDNVLHLVLAGILLYGGLAHRARGGEMRAGRAA